MQPVRYSVKIYDLTNKELKDLSRAISESSSSRKRNFALFTVVAVSAASIVGLPLAAGLLLYEDIRICNKKSEAFKNLKAIKDLQIRNSTYEPTIITWEDGKVTATLGEHTKALRRDARIQNFGFSIAATRSTQTTPEPSTTADTSSVASDEYYDSVSELHPLITFPDEAK